MDHFELVSEYAPTGDQPQAIEQLVQGGLRKATNARPFLVSPVPVRHLRWRMSFRN